MNKDIREGLALLCMAAALGLIWLIGHPTEEPGFGESDSLFESLAQLFGGLGVITALGGLVVIVKGLASEQSDDQ